MVMFGQSQYRHKAPFNVTPTEAGKLMDWKANPDEVRSAAGDDIYFVHYLHDMQDFLNGFFPDRVPVRRDDT